MRVCSIVLDIWRRQRRPARRRRRLLKIHTGSVNLFKILGGVAGKGHTGSREALGGPRCSRPAAPTTPVDIAALEGAEGDHLANLAPGKLVAVAVVAVVAVVVVVAVAW